MTTGKTSSNSHVAKSQVPGPPISPPELKFAQIELVEIEEKFRHVKELRRQFFDVVWRLVKRLPSGRDRVELSVSDVKPDTLKEL